MLAARIPTPLQAVADPRLTQRGVSLWVKRDDLIHPRISGNKWRKLQYNLLAAQCLGYDTLLTFGGAYSNHIHATAAAAELFGFHSIGIIRGEAHYPLNRTLRFARACGMSLDYMARTRYREKHSPETLAWLRERFGAFYLLPEGGSNALAVAGCRELAIELTRQTAGGFDVVAVACGTGATLAGIAAGLPPGKRALGFAVLKGGGFLAEAVAGFLGEADAGNWSLNTDFHFGGYAKCTPGLLNFMNDFEDRHGIPIEPIYTAKMLYGLYDLIERGAFSAGTRIIAVHTGGLQGRV